MKAQNVDALKKQRIPLKRLKCFKIAANLVRQSSSDDSIV